MHKFTLSVELKSSVIIGSGEGFGATIDTDIVFDEVGIPYLPAKRVKGCLLDSAKQIKDMFGLAEIDFSPTPEKWENCVKKTFGEIGQEAPCDVYFANLFIENYQENKAWLQYLTENYSIFSCDNILKTFTEIRHHTAIDDKGIAKDTSLRTVRALKQGLKFLGEIELQEMFQAQVLALACSNLKYLGTKRNRGFGEVECQLLDENGDNYVEKVILELETSCTQ